MSHLSHGLGAGGFLEHDASPHSLFDPNKHLKEFSLHLGEGRR